MVNRVSTSIDRLSTRRVHLDCRFLQSITNLIPPDEMAMGDGDGEGDVVLLGDGHGEEKGEF